MICLRSAKVSLILKGDELRNSISSLRLRSKNVLSPQPCRQYHVLVTPPGRRIPTTLLRRFEQTASLWWTLITYHYVCLLQVEFSVRYYPQSLVSVQSCLSCGVFALSPFKQSGCFEGRNTDRLHDKRRGSKYRCYVNIQKRFSLTRSTCGGWDELRSNIDIER